MARVIYDQEMMGLINLLNRLTKARIRDCFKEGDIIYCLVEKGEMGKAIGKGGANIKKIELVLKKKVKFIEFQETAAGLVQSLIYPMKVEEIREVDKAVEIISDDRKLKGRLIGRDSYNLKFLNRVVHRFFDVEVKVV